MPTPEPFDVVLENIRKKTRETSPQTLTRAERESALSALAHAYHDNETDKATDIRSILSHRVFDDYWQRKLDEKYGLVAEPSHTFSKGRSAFEVFVGKFGARRHDKDNYRNCPFFNLSVRFNHYDAIERDVTVVASAAFTEGETGNTEKFKAAEKLADNCIRYHGSLGFELKAAVVYAQALLALMTHNPTKALELYERLFYLLLSAEFTLSANAVNRKNTGYSIGASHIYQFSSLSAFQQHAQEKLVELKKACSAYSHLAQRCNGDKHSGFRLRY